MFRWLRKRRAIRAYRRELGPQLRERYGSKRHYSREEVFGTVRAAGFSEEFDCFALAMYCEQGEFDAYHQATGLACDYGAMRATAGCAVFDGAPMFDMSTDHGQATSHDHGHATSHDTQHGSWLDVFHGGGHDGGSGGHDGGGDFGGGHHGH